MKNKIGVLAVQGAFAEHMTALHKLGVQGFEIRNKLDLKRSMDGLILPGGESTVMGKLLHELELFQELKDAITQGLPVMGTCAGLILLAKNISNDESRYFSTMDIEVKRNAYGRQLGSFCMQGEFKGIGAVPMTFIRAPYIEKAASSVDVLAEEKNHIVAARQKNMLVTAFHPELTNDFRIHQYFLEHVK